MKQIEIGWETKHFGTVTREGYAPETQSLASLFDQSFIPEAQRKARPKMVAFVSMEPDPKGMARMFGSQDVGAGARFFDCTKIFVEDLSSKADRENYGKVVPTIVFLDSKCVERARISGNQIDPPLILRTMDKVAALEFKEAFTALVQRYRDLVKKFDKTADELANLDDEIKGLEDHLAKHDCETARRGLVDAKREQVAATANKAKLDAEEKKLLKPELKPAKDAKN